MRRFTQSRKREKILYKFSRKDAKSQRVKDILE